MYNYNLRIRPRAIVRQRPFPLNGLVLYAPLWHPELNGSSFKSKDLNAHTCTVTGATWGLQGRTFNGTSDGISVANTVPTVGQNFTAEAWVNWSGATGTFDWFIDRNFARPFSIQPTTTDWIFKVRDTLATVYSYISTTAPVVGEFTHVAVVFNGDSDLINIFLNGALDIQFTDITYTVQEDLTRAVTIGREAGSHYFSGIIGEVRIYSRALELAEIKQNYQTTKWRYQ